MGVLARLFDATLRRERAEAERLGISVTEVEREIALYSRDGERMITRPYRCVRYALPRRERRGRTWTLLQRHPSHGANLPNDFLLDASAPLPGGLEEQLLKVAQAYAEELFEFEATASEVAVYWSEWGGPAKVRALHAHLERLAAY